MRAKTIILTIMSAAAISMVLGGTADAGRFCQSSVYNCHATGGRAVDSMYAIANDSTTSDLVLRCDINNTNELRKFWVDYFVVNGRDGTRSGRISAQLCRSSYAVPGGACGPTSYSNTADVRNEELNLDVNVWDVTHQRDYGYVAIRIPRKDGTSRSSINGFRYGWD